VHRRHVFLPSLALGVFPANRSWQRRATCTILGHCANEVASEIAISVSSSCVRPDNPRGTPPNSAGMSLRSAELGPWASIYEEGLPSAAFRPVSPRSTVQPLSPPKVRSQKVSRCSTHNGFSGTRNLPTSTRRRLRIVKHRRLQLRLPLDPVQIQDLCEIFLRS